MHPSDAMAAFLAKRSRKILGTANSSSGTLIANAYSSSTIPITATLLHGDGIVPELVESIKQVFNVASVPVQWEEHYIGTQTDPRTQSFLTWECLESLRRNKVGLKGPTQIPRGRVGRCFSLTQRKEMKFYAKVRPCFSFPGYKTHYDNVNLIIIHENEYSGIEHQVVKGVVQSRKVITSDTSLRVAEYAFHYAKTHGRKKVSAIHKVNIMQKTDGLFLKCCQEIAIKYPDIIYEEVVIDNCCMNLVKDPSVFDVLVMKNLYGDIISNLCAGLVGGIGLTSSCKIGEDDIALAEVVHNIAGKNLTNPIAMLLSGVMLLRHLKFNKEAEQIQKAIIKTIEEGKYRTFDLGGTSTTMEFTNAICYRL